MQTYTRSPMPYSAPHRACSACRGQVQSWPGRDPHTLFSPLQDTCEVSSGPLALSPGGMQTSGPRAHAEDSNPPSPQQAPASLSSLYPSLSGLGSAIVWERTDQKVVNTCQGDSKLCCQSPQSLQQVWTVGERPSGDVPGGLICSSNTDDGQTCFHLTSL